MKRFTLAILLCLASVAAMAQHATTFNQRLFDAKMAEMAYRLKLTDKQVADFRPVYVQQGHDCRMGRTLHPKQNQAADQQRGIRTNKEAHGASAACTRSAHPLYGPFCHHPQRGTVEAVLPSGEWYPEASARSQGLRRS